MKSQTAELSQACTESAVQFILYVMMTLYVCTYMVTLCLLYGDNVHTYVVTLCHPCGDIVLTYMVTLCLLYGNNVRMCMVIL